MTMYVADNAQLQSPAPRTIGQLSVSLLGWLARKVASQDVELVKTPDECRVDFEAPMHGQRPQVSFVMANNPYYPIIKIAGSQSSKYWSRGV